MLFVECKQLSPATERPCLMRYDQMRNASRARCQPKAPLLMLSHGCVLCFATQKVKDSLRKQGRLTSLRRQQQAWTRKLGRSFRGCGVPTQVTTTSRALGAQRSNQPQTALTRTAPPLLEKRVSFICDTAGRGFDRELWRKKAG